MKKGVIFNWEILGVFIVYIINFLKDNELVVIKNNLEYIEIILKVYIDGKINIDYFGGYVV